MSPADTQEILAERLNAEPVIFRGCSASELGVIVALATGLWLPLSLLLAWWGGALTMLWLRRDRYCRHGAVRRQPLSAF